MSALRIVQKVKNCHQVFSRNEIIWLVRDYIPQLDGVECAVMEVQGKAQLCCMAIPFQGVATPPCAARTVQSAP